jgi:hypothetical protein
LTVVLHKTGEYLKGLGPKCQFLAAATQASTLHVQRELAERVTAVWPFALIRIRAASPASLHDAPPCGSQ